MVNKKFEEYKINRELKRSGIKYEFYRKGKNEFGESTDELELIGSAKGLYHEQNSYIKTTVNEAAVVKSKKIPMILFLYVDIANFSLEANDLVKVNEKMFKITGITNVQEWNVLLDVSLEVMDNGN